jgi:hypothetical protein
MWKLSPLSRDCQGLKELSDRVIAAQENVDDKVKREKLEYDESLAKVSTASSSAIDLGMTVKFVDGDEVIADSSQVSGGILAACKEYEAYVGSRTASAK